MEGISSGISPAECLNFSNATSGISACTLRNLAEESRHGRNFTWETRKEKGIFVIYLNNTSITPLLRGWIKPFIPQIQSVLAFQLKSHQWNALNQRNSHSQIPLHSANPSKEHCVRSYF